MRKHLFAGLIILLPLVLTIFLIHFIVNLFTHPFLDIATYFLSKFPNLYSFLTDHNLLEPIAKIFILILLVIFIFILGIVARWFFFTTLLSITNAIFSKIPIVKSIYTTSKDVINALFPQKNKKKAFSKSVLVPFPSRESYTIGFVSGEVPECCQEKINSPLVSVFVPTAPHPISGFFMLFPASDVHDVDMTNEDSVKFIVSCGVILPVGKKHE